MSVTSPLTDCLSSTDQFISSGAGSIRNSKSQDVCHIAFGSRVLGPPPLSGRRNNLRLSTEVGRRFEKLTQAGTEVLTDLWVVGRRKEKLTVCRKSWLCAWSRLINFQQKFWILNDFNFFFCHVNIIKICCSPFIKHVVTGKSLWTYVVISGKRKVGCNHSMHSFSSGLLFIFNFLRVFDMLDDSYSALPVAGRHSSQGILICV